MPIAVDILVVAAAANGRRFVGSVNVVCNTNTKLSHAVGDVAGEELVPKQPHEYDVEVYILGEEIRRLELLKCQV